MNRSPIFILCIAAVVMTSCTPVVERAEVEPPPPTPTPTPVPTPHPALAARERAAQLYPDLGVKDSLFHRTFMEIFDQTKERNPQMLATLDWPISVAHQAGNMLGVSPGKPEPPPPPPPPPTPPPPQIIYVTPKLGSSLDRGAYDKKRGVTSTPSYR